MKGATHLLQRTLQIPLLIKICSKYWQRTVTRSFQVGIASNRGLLNLGESDLEIVLTARQARIGIIYFFNLELPYSLHWGFECY